MKSSSGVCEGMYGLTCSLYHLWIGFCILEHRSILYFRWFTDKPKEMKLQDVVMTIRDARLVLTCISDDFVKDNHILTFFDFARSNLQVSLI